jgi:hypothetical protein
MLYFKEFIHDNCCRDLSDIHDNHKGEPAVTFAMVDKVHQRPDGTAKRTFSENRARFVPGEDLVEVPWDAFGGTNFVPPNRGGNRKPIILLTRRGYLKLVKPMLMFNGAVIHDRSDTLSLTDMWRAAGSADPKRPSDWLALTSTKDFIEVVVGTLDAGNSGIQTKKGGRGIGGVTFAHWQIALAYAKYLSPEFHMWCNTVVRERMEASGAIADPQRHDTPMDLEVRHEVGPAPVLGQELRRVPGEGPGGVVQSRHGIAELVALRVSVGADHDETRHLRESRSAGEKQFVALGAGDDHHVRPGGTLRSRRIEDPVADGGGDGGVSRERGADDGGRGHLASSGLQCGGRAG